MANTAPARPADSSVGTARLVTFTDAVAAIALTLLVLPLVDLIPQAAEKQDPEIADVLVRIGPEIGAFTLSFAVIFRFWWAHHRQFEHITRVTVPLVVVSAFWCFGIVILPLPTAVITRFPPSAGTVILYTGTLVLLSGCLFAVTLIGLRHPEICDPANPITTRQLRGSITILGAQILACVIGAVFAQTINFWALTLMLLVGPVEWLWGRLRQPASPHPPQAELEERTVEGPVPAAADDHRSQ